MKMSVVHWWNDTDKVMVHWWNDTDKVMVHWWNDTDNVLVHWWNDTDKVILREIPVPVAFCPPLISHGLTWDPTWASAVKGWRLTA
jgi:hypothetical protein